jgi:thiamine pyrophosphokinase
MTSSYAILQRLANSLFVKAGQSESLSKLVSSVYKTKKSKNTTTTEKSSSANVEKTPSSPKVSLKDAPKPTIATPNQDTYIIDNKYLDHFEKDENTEIYIIYLNRPFDLQTLRSLHKISSFTIMADGAANRFYDKFVIQAEENEIIPHALVGDFDSIRKDVMEYYKEKNVEIFHDKSQDDTDLEKCLRQLQKRIQDEQSYKKEKSYRLIITGGFGGRMDHTLNNIHILHKFAEKFAKQHNISLHLIDNNSIGTCILPGKTTYIRSKHFEQDAGCGMFPLLGEQAKVQTKGLKWDVGQDAPALSFKKFVSSSNEMVGEVVEFETDSIIFWTTTNTIHGRHSED